MDKQIKYSPKSDIGGINLQDLMPEEGIKVFPYELPNAINSEIFIGNQATSIVYATQNNLDIDNLQRDEDGNFYFIMTAAITDSTELTFSTFTESISRHLRETTNLTCLSNYYFKTKKENLQVGTVSVVPAIFTIGVPFNRASYEAGKQDIFLPTSIIEATEGRAQFMEEEINPEGLYETNLINLNYLLAEYSNAKFIFTTTFDTKTDKIITHDGNNTGITLAFENHTLINSVKAKGVVEEFEGGGAEFDNINFKVTEPMAPFKMTPVNTEGKVEMYADWFDYDVVMPFAFAALFEVPKPLGEVIKNKDDLYMVLDMLLVSAGFAESWKNAKYLPADDQGNAGKIDPAYTIGYNKIIVTAIVGQDPIKVVDGIYENHIRKFPAYNTTKSRYQPVKEVLCALSRYIYSNYAIGKGQNSFNQVYLPWYLQPESALVANDKNLLEADTTFQIWTSYFRDDFTNNKELSSQKTLILPDNINLSNDVLIQTDRKLSLPTLPEQIQAMNKLPLPGDIDTLSSNDLSYLFFLPIQKQIRPGKPDKSPQTIFEEFFLDKLTTKETISAGTDVTVHLLDNSDKIGDDGKIWTQAEINAEAIRLHRGTLKVPSVITQIESNDKIFEIQQDQNFSGVSYDVINVGRPQYSMTIINGNTFIKEIAKRNRYEDIESIKELTVDGNKVTDSTKNLKIDAPLSFRYLVKFKVTHSEFTPAVVTSAGGIKDTYSFEARQVQFDKQQWKRYLHGFGIIPNQAVSYKLLSEEDFTIKNISEIVISSIWGNYVEFLVAGRTIAKIPLVNSRDETISIQRILLT